MEAILPAILKENFFAGVGLIVLMLLLTWGGWQGVVGVVKYLNHGRKVDTMDVSERYLDLNDKWVAAMSTRMDSLVLTNEQLTSQVSEYQRQVYELGKQLAVMEESHAQMGRQVSESQKESRLAMSRCEELGRRCAALEREGEARARLITKLQTQASATTLRLDRIAKDMDELLAWVQTNVPAEQQPPRWRGATGRAHRLTASPVRPT